MKTINLNKQKVMSLTSNELSNVIGGGEKRSDKLSGGCRYSRKNPEIAPCQSSGQQHVTGCAAATVAVSL